MNHRESIKLTLLVGGWTAATIALIFMAVLLPSILGGWVIDERIDQRMKVNEDTLVTLDSVSDPHELKEIIESIDARPSVVARILEKGPLGFRTVTREITADTEYEEPLKIQDVPGFLAAVNSTSDIHGRAAIEVYTPDRGDHILYTVWRWMPGTQLVVIGFPKSDIEFRTENRFTSIAMTFLVATMIVAGLGFVVTRYLIITRTRHVIEEREKVVRDRMEGIRYGRDD